MNPRGGRWWGFYNADVSPSWPPHPLENHSCPTPRAGASLWRRDNVSGGTVGPSAMLMQSHMSLHHPHHPTSILHTSHNKLSCTPSLLGSFLPPDTVPSAHDGRAAFSPWQTPSHPLIPSHMSSSSSILPCDYAYLNARWWALWIWTGEDTWDRGAEVEHLLDTRWVTAIINKANVYWALNVHPTLF